MTVSRADLISLLRVALKHVANPAISRLPEASRTVDGLSHAYLPQVKCASLSDPGGAHTYLIALVLALGLDPGPSGLGIRLYRHENVSGGCAPMRAWMVQTQGSAVVFASDSGGFRTPKHFRLAPAVAAEPDPIKALEHIIRYVLENSHVLENS